MLTKDLSQENILLSKGDGLSRYSQAIVCDFVDRHLFVSNTSDSNNKGDCIKLQ